MGVEAIYFWGINHPPSICMYWKQLNSLWMFLRKFTSMEIGNTHWHTYVSVFYIYPLYQVICIVYVRRRGVYVLYNNQMFIYIVRYTLVNGTCVVCFIPYTRANNFVKPIFCGDVLLRFCHIFSVYLNYICLYVLYV